ncbi:MAG: methionine--tRNA ligase [Cyclobacteriaceae bacterium]|nr:methionine--tRNA ligase [Cyclobacteriaceae bacterium]MCH8515388.1 methionine--tRNA ligase [Cyclobacteriaceae bacterium]
MKNTNRYTLTAALPYANGPLHIGHIAGAYLPADIFARYQRLQDRDVLFVCGSDEHGAAITIRAKKEGISPQEIIDRYHQQIKDTFERFGMSFDIYHRTSSPIHHELSQEFFTNLYEKGEFIEKETEQFYDADYDQFLADRYVMGTCPNCGHDAAYGDQCEACGSSLHPTDLINPKSTLSGKAPELRSTKHWFLPLDSYQAWLEEWLIEGKKGEWKTNVYGQCSSWLKSGLQARSMTRDLDWGVDVPLPEAEGKKLYVWLDAPIGYISASKQWALDHGKEWEPYWKKQADEQDNSRLIHFIGKDNIVFHCITFPSILKAHGEYILPDNVPANEFLNLEGKKISTSRNWAVWLHEFLDELPGKEDVLRYVLCANAPENKDNDFTWKDFQARNNNELVAIYGNFVNRALVLTQKYYDGKVPAAGELTERDEELLKVIDLYPGKIAASIEKYRFREALSIFMDMAREGNRYLAEVEPWKVVKEDPERVKTIMNVALQCTAALAIASEPFLPFSSSKLKGMLNLQDKSWRDLSRELLKSGHQVEKPSLLFEKIEDELVDQQVQKLENSKKMNEGEAASPELTPLKEEIQFDDFMKMDIRVGTILSAEKMKKSKKLLKLEIDTGIDKRTILSGIAQHFEPEAVVGQQVLVLANLAPRVMMGIESQGMVLMAEDTEGKLVFAQADGKIGAGSTIS